MGSTIAGQALFDSGPHRFVTRSLGTLFVPPLFFDPVQVTTDVITPLELSIEQRGRLVGPGEAGLWSQVEAIRAAAEAQLNGDLVDNHGRVWVNMTFLRFRPADRVDRGRVVSLAYEADYIRLAG